MDIHSTVYIAPGAHVVGDVTIEENSSVWYNAVIRGDVAPISIGKGSNIQDLSMVHVAKNYPTCIGNGVVVGHSAILHGCTVDDNTLIGMGTIVLNGAHIGKNCIVGAGSLITQNKEFPEGSLILGSPARALRKLTDEEIEGIHRSADLYVKLAEENLTK